MNFEFIKNFKDFKYIYEYCNDAEKLALKRPYLSVMSARNALEGIVKLLYSSYVGDYYGITLFDMLNNPIFKSHVDDVLLETMDYIRKNGNIGSHQGDVSVDDAVKNLEKLHFLVGEYFLTIGLIDDYDEFIKPTKSSKADGEDNKKTIDKPIDIPAEVIAKYSDKLSQVRFVPVKDGNHAENHILYTRACLREAGWKIVPQTNLAMPKCASIDMILDDGSTIDYILYGKDNKPLAIVEYTETSKNIVLGRNKAIKVADKMAVKLGYKPIIYYTTGYNIYIIDQLGYEPRRVTQFHTIEELELLKLRKTIRKDISSPVINDDITNRYYQKEAIKAACNAFNSNRRRSLLVMATGTGKTRVSISIVDILMKNNWVKNVLFLADRTSLANQANKNFNKLLPSITTSLYTGDNIDRDSNARIIFSTYQTMINLINDDTREFSIGRFDLIIIDEAHRSIFRKFGSLFEYFDSLLLGLTATPRNEDSKSTYEVFQMPNDEPDYSYDLWPAVKDNYLVGYKLLKRKTFLSTSTQILPRRPAAWRAPVG